MPLKLLIRRAPKLRSTRFHPDETIEYILFKDGWEGVSMVHPKCRRGNCPQILA